MRHDDRAVVARLLSGDQHAFRLFFDEYFDRLYRFALARTGGRADRAEEAAQRALCRAVRALAQFRGEASLFTWLAQICRNEIADLAEAEQRDRQRFESYDASERARERAERHADQAGSPPDIAQAEDSSTLIRRLLDELPGRYGEVLEMKYLEERSVDDIAAHLGMTFEAAQSLLARARLAFRSALTARGLDWTEYLP